MLRNNNEQHLLQYLVALPVFLPLVIGAIIDADPSETILQIQAKIDALQPGDELVLASGTYSSVRLDLTGKTGTETDHIIIRGPAQGSTDTRPLIVANTDAFQEPILVGGGTAYIDIRDLRLTQSGSDTQAGILFNDDANNVLIENVEIFDINGIGIQMQVKRDISYVTIRDCHIHNTGLDSTNGNNGGQGFTAGYFDSASGNGINVHHLVLQGNLIHDCRGQEGECAKFMYGVSASQMLDNVMFNCPRGSAQVENYGIAVYNGGYISSRSDVNVVSRNFVYGTRGSAGDSNVGIYVGSQTIVHNNLILDSNQGLVLRREGGDFSNTEIIGNTVYKCTEWCFSVRDIPTASQASTIIANNAFICDNTECFGYRNFPEGDGSGTYATSLFEGQNYGEFSSNVMAEYTGSITQLFANPSLTIPGANFVPNNGSELIQSRPDPYLIVDFDNINRADTGATSVQGCYGTAASGRWALAFNFKGNTGNVAEFSSDTENSGATAMKSILF